MTKTALGWMMTGVLALLSLTSQGNHESPGCPAAACMACDSDDRLDLELLATYPLPPGVLVRGGALMGDVPVVWGPDAVILYGDAGPPHVASLDPPGEWVGLGVDPQSSELLGWDTQAGVVRRLTPDGVTAASTPVSGVPEVTRAERVSDGWVVQRFDGLDRTSVFSIVPDRGGPPVHLDASSFTVPDGAPPVRPLRLMGADPGGALIVEQSSPWRVWRVDFGDAGPQPTLLSGSEELFDRIVAAEFPTGSVAPLSILPLDRGLLYELAHLGGDERLLVLFDGEGCLIRLTPIDIALGFIASHPERRLLLAEAQGAWPCEYCDDWDWTQFPECVTAEWDEQGSESCLEDIGGCDPLEPNNCWGDIHHMSDGGLPSWSVTPTGVMAETVVFASTTSGLIDPAARLFKRDCKGFVQQRTFGAEVQASLTRASKRLTL